MRDTIVIIDDNELDLAILNEIFKNKFQVHCFSSALKAVGFIQQNKNKIAVILLDICLGRAGAGFHVMQHLNSHKQLNHIPTILMTSDANEQYVREAIEHGAIDFLAKPVDPHSICERVDQLIQQVWNGEVQENSENEQLEMVWSADDVKQIAQLWMKRMQILCRTRPVISVQHCEAIQKITSVLVNTYLQEQQECENQLDELDAAMISYAAGFYDIGRIGIPDENMQSDTDPILSDLYQEHMSIGREYFSLEREQNSFYMYCAQIAYWHHKNMDGSGYPSAEDASAIPLSAQFVRTALRCDFYAHHFYQEKNCMKRVLNSLASEINHVMSFQMYELVRLSKDKLEELFSVLYQQ